MSVYDRAPRKIGFHVGDTADIVGPGSYETELAVKTRRRADGYAPFGSMVGRGSSFHIGDQVVAAPGPGYYDVQNAQDKVKGGKTLSNTDSRFKEYQLKAKNPGPGTYDTQKHEEFGSKLSRSAPPAVKGTLMSSSRVKYERKPEAPSIPMPGQAYGFEENEDGTLNKQDAPNRDTSIGPAYYSSKKGATKVTERYKGNHWGKMSEQRFSSFAGKAGPGPGAYEAFQENQPQYENQHLRPDKSQRFEANIPRYHQAIEKDNAKKNIPGPGNYSIKGQFDSQDKKINMDGIEVEHPPFGSQAKRFSGKKDAKPGPGTYNDPRHALEVSKKPSGMKRSPFNTTAVRFHGTGPAPRPGPGAYNVTGMGSDSMRRAYVESTRRGVFGSTAVRITPMTGKQAYDNPGPAHYQPKEKVGQGRYQQMTANFASVTSRFREGAGPGAEKPEEEQPGPAAYHIAQAYNAASGKRPPAVPRSEAAARRKGAFQSSASRFADIPDPKVAKTDVSVPGPGQYSPGEKNKVGNMLYSKDKRFRAKHEETPGPGTYEFSPLVQDSVLRATFNATLNNPVAERLEPGLQQGNISKQAFMLGV